MRRLALIALLALGTPAFGHAATPTPTLTPLSAADVPALLKPPAHGVRIIALWSLDCVYCEANMQTLAKWQRAHPRDVELVTVATDGITQDGAIEARLRAAHMDGYPAYTYAEASPEHLDFLIDPNWGGEMPRTEIVRADGKRGGISGAISDAQLEKL